MGMEKIITQKITDEITPTTLEVINESHLHAGHMEKDSKDSHFRVKAVAEKFEGVSAVKRHQMVYGVLSEEFEAGLHALALELKAPSEI